MCFAAAVLVCGCDGEIRTSKPSAPNGADEPSCDALATGWGPLRRVTHEEYDNSVSVLTGTSTRPALAFPPQAKSNAFTNGSAQQTVGELQAEAYFEAAEALASEATKSQVCDAASRRCAVEFKLKVTTQQSAEVRGTFRPDGWARGEPMARMGDFWVARVEVPVGAAIQYKFFVNGTTWLLDPANLATGTTAGVTNSLMTGTMCAQWSCAANSGWPAVLQCDPALGKDTCAERFIERFGARAFRRALTADELASYRGLVAAVTAQLDFSSAIQATISAMLQSPHFLYHVERGTEVAPGVERLDGPTLAARLATALWQSLPDDALIAAAAAGELSTAAQVEAQARRMVADPRARPVLTRMFVELTRADELDRVPKDLSLYPSWESVRGPMGEETARFVESVLFDGDGSVKSLFTARHTFVDPNLATHYGLPAVTGWQRVSLEGEPRLGLLTQGAVLAANAKTNQSSPTLRGLFVRESLLCDPPPPPPKDANIVPPDVKAGVPTRERYAEHSTNPGCRACHRLMDPVGLGFEHFDAVGKWRDSDEGAPVDSSGEIFDSDVAGPFDGVEQLATRLSESHDVASCLSTQTFRYLTARHETDADRCSLLEVQRHLTDHGFKLEELAIGLVGSDSFRHRKVQP